MEDIRFYCGIGEQQWNHHPVAPGPYACISPVYGNTLAGKRVNRVWVPDGTQVIQDSGAFSDGPGQRLNFEEALERQMSHAQTYGYAHMLTHRASYDLLIDEKWENGVRHKARWTESEAELAVKITVNAAKYLSEHRNNLALILSAQGVSAKQYVKCAEQIIPLMQPGDIFGLGGFCIIGKYPSMMAVFREIIQGVIPLLGKANINVIHIWGVCYAPALGELLYLCDMEGIALRTDSVGPSVKPCMGEWGYASWRDNSYSRPAPEIRGLERARHVAATYDWMAHFRERESTYYRFVPIKARKYYQASWLEEAV